MVADFEEKPFAEPTGEEPEPEEDRTHPTVTAWDRLCAKLEEYFRTPWPSSGD